MVNILVQFVTLLNGLLLNFLAPAVYGLHAYGEFIAANAMVFFVYKSVTIISEPLIRLTEPKYLLFVLLTLTAVAVVLMGLLSLVWSPGSLLMLLGILAFSNVLITLQAMRLRRMYIAVQLTAIGMFIGLLFAAHIRGFTLSIERLMEWTTLIPAMMGILLLVLKRVQMPTWKILILSLNELIRLMPHMLSLTAVMNLFTNALPLFLAQVLIPRDLGLFRVATAIIQSATSVFPASTQAMLVAFTRAGEKAGGLYRSVASLALLYFSLGALVLILVAQGFPQLAPYLVLASCLPIYYHAVLAERFLTSQHVLRPLRVANLSVCIIAILALLFVDTLGKAMLHYAAGLTVYAVILTFLIAKRWEKLRPSVWLMMLCPLAVMTAITQPWIGMAAMVLIFAIVMLRTRFTLADVKATLRAI